MEEDISLKINQNIFWKLIFFCSSILFAGLFVSMPLSIAIVVMIQMHCCAHLFAREKLKMISVGIIHMPFFGAITIHNNSDFRLIDLFISTIAGSIAGLICTLVFALYYYFFQDPFIGEITKVLTIINLINLFPLYLLDGHSIILSLSFGKNKIIEFFTIAIGILVALHIYSTLPFSIISLFWGVMAYLSIVTFKKLVFPIVVKKEMTNVERIISFQIYLLVISSFAFLYDAFKGFSSTGASVSWLLQ